MTDGPDILTRLLIVERKLDELDAEFTRVFGNNIDLRRENEQLRKEVAAYWDEQDSHDAYLYQQAKKEWYDPPTPDERRGT